MCALAFPRELNYIFMERVLLGMHFRPDSVEYIGVDVHLNTHLIGIMALSQWLRNLPS